MPYAIESGLVGIEILPGRNRYLRVVRKIGIKISNDDIPVKCRDLFAYLFLKTYPGGDRDQQWCPPKPERLPLRAFYVLGDEPPPTEEIVVRRLSPREATAELVSHTVAWTLFVPDLLTQHFEFCASTPQVVPVRELSYPRRIELLSEVAEVIRADLEGDRP